MNVKRRYAILTLTQGALVQGRRLQVLLPDSDLYVNKRFMCQLDQREYTISQPLSELTPELFKRYDCLIWIMASGIVVRSIAPLIQHKAQDPAILIIDEQGQNVISLLSGHLGKANDDTRHIASLLNANPVITTASDVSGSLAVDTLAMQLDCAIDNLYAAKCVTAEIVNGNPVAVLSSENVDITLPPNMHLVSDSDLPTLLTQCSACVVIQETPPPQLNDLIAWLIPRRIVAGMGCRRGKPKETLLAMINKAFDQAGIDPRALCAIASVDIKADEEGLIAAAAQLNVPLNIVSREQIQQLETQTSHSDFVQQTIGVGGVCEPAALIISQGSLILPKQSENGVTIALAKIVKQECGK